MIGLIDFLQASKVAFALAETKVHLACWNGIEHPLEVFFAGRFKKWQEHQNRRNFGCKHILSLIDLGASHWLFVGVYDVHSFAPHPKYPSVFLYSTSLRPGQDDLIGKVIVSHQRTRQSYVWLRAEVALPLVELRREKMTVGDFPGYNAVTISHSKLRIITQQKLASWRAALANIKGVYLITDTSTGKHYVGKASGNVGIWQRWCAYADNGHGGNVELKALLVTNGPDHVRHFQYSILEIADTHASDGDILARESYWMTALQSRKFGLNGTAGKPTSAPGSGPSPALEMDGTP
jgi:hypothetical protein